MRALRGWWPPPKNVMRVGLGVVMAAALTVAVVAETTAASSAGPSHRRIEPKVHRQRVNHFNVGATHSPRLLRQLRARGCSAGRGCGLVSAPERAGN